MSRNGSGTYSVVNTFVSGNSITASGHNQNWTDIATEITNSVAADGQTPITGTIKNANGTVSLPSVTFNSDQDTGFYRKAANSVALTLGGTDSVVWASTSASFAGGASFAGAVGITGEFIASATATFILTANFSTKPVVPAKSFAISKIADGTANRLYGTDGSGVATEVTLGTGVALSSSALTATAQLARGYIDGCTLANGADTTNDITIAAGVCRDSTNAVNITVAAMTTGKQLDANWAVGDAAGMRNSAVGIANTTYHIYTVSTAAGVQDIYAHTSTTVATVITALQAESGGSSYIYARRIGSIVRASNAILQFTQNGNLFLLTTPVADVANTADHTTAATGTLASMPTGLTAIAQLLVGANDNTNGNGNLGVYLSALSQTDSTPSNTAAPGLTVAGTGGASYGWVGGVEILTNTSAQVRYRSNSALIDTIIVTSGWLDSRGKDA